jgi:hypothetical protein
VFEKLVVGPVNTGQTGKARDTPKTFSFTPTLHQRDEVAQVRLEGFVSTLKTLMAIFSQGLSKITLTWSTR